MRLNKAFYLYLTFVAILWAIIWWCLLINMHQYFSAVFYGQMTHHNNTLEGEVIRKLIGSVDQVLAK